MGGNLYFFILKYSLGINKIGQTFIYSCLKVRCTRVSVI